MKYTCSVQRLLATKIRHSIQLASLLLAVAVVGCSSVKTNVNKGSVTARTFSFLNTGSRQLPSFAEPRQQAHQLIQQALISNLAARGINHVASGGDITVAYLVVVGNNAATTSLNEYFGYTDDSEAMLQKVHSDQTSGDSGRNYFEAGTLVIDILDPTTSKLLQRRSIQAQVLRNLSPEIRTARVQSLVDQALKDLPLSSGKVAENVH